MNDVKVGNTFVVTTNTNKSFEVIARLDTDVEIEYYKNGGIL